MPNSEDKVSAVFHLRRVRAHWYLAATLVVLSASILLALLKGDWQWLSRSGGIISLFGAFLALRRLFRVGAQRYFEPDEPLTLPTSNPKAVQLNMRAIMQGVEGLSDAYAQWVGLVLVVLGTIIGGYGDVIMQLIYPLTAELAK